MKPSIRIVLLFFSILSIRNSWACTGLDILIDVTNVNCFEGNDGSIEVVPSFIATDLPYEYSLNGSGFSANNTFNNLTAGNYNLVVRNNLGCVYNHPSVIEIIEPQALLVELDFNPIVCGNDAKVFANISGGTGPYLYTWNGDPNVKMDTLRGINDGTFDLEVTDQNGCIETESITIAPELPFTIEIEADVTEIEIGDEIFLTSTVNRGSGNYSYQWFPDNDFECSTCSETSSSFFKDTELVLVVHDLDRGCVDSDTIFITVDGTFSLFIPNAFSPNGDSRNETFLVYGVGLATAILNIYDKNGFLVYTGDGLLKGWDGRVSGNPAADGLYFYHANVVYTDGTIHEQKGQITLIR